MLIYEGNNNKKMFFEALDTLYFWLFATKHSCFYFKKGKYCKNISIT